MATENGCDEEGNDVEVAEGRTFCIVGLNYVLAVTPDPDKNCGYAEDDYSPVEDPNDLPGANSLDGTQWGGLIVEGIVVGCRPQSKGRHECRTLEYSPAHLRRDPTYATTAAGAIALVRGVLGLVLIVKILDGKR